MNVDKPRTLVTVPATANRGEIITLRALAQHVMENGFRHDERGRRIPRDTIERFRCLFNGVEVFRADLQGGIAANPLMQFTVVAQESGEFEFQWEGDRGYQARATASIQVK
jgi:sulfur-oxidizing protein SoxZ